MRFLGNSVKQYPFVFLSMDVHSGCFPTDLRIALRLVITDVRISLRLVITDVRIALRLVITDIRISHMLGLH